MKITKKEKDDSERWMLSYLDFITLLMIFFLMMYAISNVDSKKYKALANSLKIGFNSGNGENIIATSDESTKIVDSLDEASTLSSAEEEKLTNIKEKVDELLKNSDLKGSVSTSIKEKGLVISFTDSVFFNSGEASIKNDWQSKLISISKILNEIDNYIRVEGNTDNIPINNSSFHSNWQLSSARAVNVVEFLISQGNINSNRLSAIGYGEYRPIKSNDTEEGRSSNRRVDIVILNDKFNKSETSG
jgi:chemotaxis protein MotB